ncbi:heme A synthase [Brevundimonas alba]|uniref:Heme A synthase n=1 Tax=Brevundimonas alba TaxID=74314 RepID=A0A7X5YJS7_9CAUL|nr:hypothetical protein [Brevundimonas alba]NJC41250.1 heme A synthase [Brevundimonas alba]
MNSAGRPRKPFGLGTYVLMLLGVGLVGGVVGAARALLGDQPGQLGLALTVAAMTFGMAVGFAACIWWWRGIDEAAREAHKWAWWWGGSGGMAVGAILLVSLTAVGGDAVAAPAGLTAPELIVGGMWTILLFQLAGYGIAWAVWWLKHR